MSPKRLKQNIALIDVLAKVKPRQRKLILKSADEDLILCICECVINVLNGNVPLRSHELQKLRRYKSHLRKFANSDGNIHDKRELLLQKGGFLPTLLAPILAIAGQFIADAIIKR